jgi:glutathione S-transferase
MTAILWHIELSMYSEKARWALDYKNVAYELRAPMPGLHRFTALALTRGAHARMPVAEIGGHRVGDSSAIVAALEEHAPDPPLYPADPSDRARALELEELFGERLAPAVRRFMWHQLLPDTDATVGALFTGRAPVRRTLLRATAPLAGRLVRKDYNVNEESATAARAEIVALADRIEAELQPSGYLAGDAFSVADLAGASLFTPLLAPPERPYLPPAIPPAAQELRDELTARRAGAWVHEMYARHRTPARALVAS